MVSPSDNSDNSDNSDFNFFNPPKLLPPTIHPVPDTPVGLQLKVVLNQTEPEIWRSIEVPGDLTLDVFHLVLQGAMGWENYHLHEFSEDREHYPFITEYMLEEDGFGYPEDDFRVDQVLREVGDNLSYHYDFGDGWEHTITVEKILDTPPDQPRCLDGARACPPEDMGGLWTLEVVVPWVESGFKKKLAPTHLDADHYRDWLGTWDPASFDAQAATRELQTLVKKSPHRLAPGLRQVMSQIPFMKGEQLYTLLDLDLWYEPAASSVALTPKMVEPYTQLFDLIGDGMKLTPAKYLPTSVVRDYADRTGLSAWWPRRITSESVTPLYGVREMSRSLGLLRVANGVIAPTKKARSLGDDPRSWEKHLRTKLPLGKTDYDRHAGWAALVVIGSGAPYEQWPDLIAEVLADMGWAKKDQWGNSYSPGFASPTYDVLDFLAEGIGSDIWERKAPEDHVIAVAALARSMVVIA